MTPSVGVVVVTHNSVAVVGALLDSLREALGDLEAEVVVVDNASSDDTVATVVQRGTRVVQAANLGYAAGINRGVLELSAGLPVLVLNPDVVLAPGSVQPLLDRLGDPAVGVVAPRMLDGDGKLTPSLRRRPTLLRSLGLGFTGLARLSEDITAEAAYDHSAEVAWATGAVLLVRRECHDALGGWDATYFLYSEETDFSLRARDHGWVTVYEPTSVAWHAGSQSGWNDELYAMQILNRVRLYGRRHSGPARWAFYVVALVREAELAVRGQRQARSALRALVRPASRPEQLGLSARLAPW